MSIRWSARRAVCPLLASLLLFAWLVASPPADAAPTWAPAATATVHPGVQTYTEGAQCTANFVFFDASDIYLGRC